MSGRKRGIPSRIDDRQQHGHFITTFVETQAFRHALEDEDAAAVERFFEEGRTGREGILGE